MPAVQNGTRQRFCQSFLVGGAEVIPGAMGRSDGGCAARGPGRDFPVPGGQGLGSGDGAGLVEQGRLRVQDSGLEVLLQEGAGLAGQGDEETEEEQPGNDFFRALTERVVQCTLTGMDARKPAG